MSEPTPGSDSVRDLAQQRSPFEPHSETPSWVGKDRHPDRQQPVVPGQALPDHDRIEKTAAEVGVRPDILQEAHWSGRHTGRTALGLMLLAALLATAGAAVLTWADRTSDNASLLGICALASVGIWAIMATTRPMTVDLSGSTLTVHHRDTEDTFDLADPFQPVEVRGSPESRGWSLVLGKLDGSTVVVGSRTVKPAELDPVVTHYRAKAEGLRRERDRRFGH